MLFYLITFITLVCVLAVDLFLSPVLQTALGTWGLAAAEFLYGILALAGGCAIIIAAQKKKVEGIDCIEIFSTRPPKIRHIFGALLLMVGVYMGSTYYSNIVLMLFPEQMNKTVQSIQNLGVRLPFANLVVIMALFPAICEELVFRGLTQYTFRQFGTDRIAVLMTGVIFGLFHIDPLRIPITAAMGIALSYICLRSGSIFVTMLMHFLNNFMSASAVAFTADMSQQVTTEAYANLARFGIPQEVLYIMSAGEILLIALGALIGGFALLEEKPMEALKKHKVTAIVIVGLLAALAVGYVVTVFRV